MSKDKNDGDADHTTTGDDGGDHTLNAELSKQVAGAVQRELAKQRSVPDDGVSLDAVIELGGGKTITVKELVASHLTHDSDRKQWERHNKGASIARGLREAGVLASSIDVVSSHFLDKDLGDDDGKALFQQFAKDHPNMIAAQTKEGGGGGGGGGDAVKTTETKTVDLTDPKVRETYFDGLAAGQQQQ